MADVKTAIQAELAAINLRSGVTRDPGKPDLFGLSFSGGGIRSATFNLGVLQHLESLGLLKYIDYLSTVSGGGYIGSWYLSCLRQKRDTGQKRQESVGHLRKFSQYLAPEIGFFSADTWTIVAIWLRNTFLLQLMLVSLFSIALLSPRFVEMAFLDFGSQFTIPAALLLFSVSVFYITANLAKIDKPAGAEITPGKNEVDGQGKVQLVVVLPSVIGAASFASALWHASGQLEFMLYAGAVVALSIWLTAWFSILPLHRRTLRGKLSVVLIGVLCGSIFVGLGYVLSEVYQGWQTTAGGQWMAALIGAPTVLIILGITVIVQIGLLGRAIQDGAREWWARLGAFLIIYSLGPLLLGLTVLFGPQLVALLTSDTLWRWIGGSITLGGVLTTIGGLFAASARDTGTPGSWRGKELLAIVAPYVFIAGLLIGVATGLHHLLWNAPSCAGIPGTWPGYWLAMDCSIKAGSDWLWYSLGVSAAVLLLFAYRIDINEASMNPFYRNRLVRCYQGAARAGDSVPADRRRTPSPFTGFDVDDDFPLSKLRPLQGFDGPIPIINTAMNLPGGQDAGLAERRATSFFFTPYYCGSGTTGVTDTTKTGRTSEGIYIGPCMATSGAAASPNMGYHTSTPVAFLMTFFNVRLGLWAKNPLSKRKQQDARWGLYYLLKELFAMAGAADNYLYLSDGGHFDNLGVYELVRRRCKYIIACDAEEDGRLVLGALGGVVRKCRIDFPGVEIEIDTSEIRGIDEKDYSRAHCAVGKIHYPATKDAAGNDAPEFDGYLIYLKSSLTGDEGSDVLQYKAQNRAFPHESTGDQFFSESQFESYRALGQHVVEKAFRPVGPAGISLTSRAEIQTWMEKLEASWTPPSPFTQSNFTRHTQTLMEIWDTAREDPDLGLADVVLFPGWTKPTPLATDGEVRRRKALYTCQRILQLMENAYLDLRLEESFNHPDNKGWKQIFETWAASDLFKETYERSQEAYGMRFRAFCERELRLPLK